MEQTINQFSKGLQLDTNPMVQSNDTLSDALNATFITQNGNEVILQNDMGNRRVDNAFLPPGYEPVGMKEYGGIIYIAAYNPITNRSQIGSFPSPERRISKLDDDNLGNIVDFIGDFRKSVKQKYSLNQEQRPNFLYWLTSDTLLYPLTNKNSIHAGDKFVVYGFTDGDSIANVTNYNNIINDDQVETPLNKTYTLQLGILNSQNEFVDITKTLVRWDESDNIIQFSNKDTDLFKFNSGYFLAKGINDNSKLEETQNDNNFINERKSQKLALNTYTYKLVGPMYLKATLNHIESFNYNITGQYDDINKIAYIKIEATITYNCPHNLQSNRGYREPGDDDYKYFDDGYIHWDNFFDFYFTDENHEKAVFIIPDSMDNENNKRDVDTYFETKYDKTINLYTTKIVKEYSNIRNVGTYNPIIEEDDGDKIYYILGVCTPQMEYLGGTTPVYLEGLSIVDVLNLSLLGSGKIASKEWRFTNSYIKNQDGEIIDGITKLLYNLESYPREDQKFVNLQMELYDITNQTLKAVVKLSEEVSNGRNEITFNWKPNSDSNPKLIQGEIEPRKLYYIKLKYQIKDEAGNYYCYNNKGEQIPGDSSQFITTNLEEEKIWFLSTRLFNVCYNQSSSDYIRCYFNPRTKKENDTIEKLCKVKVKLIPNDEIISNEEIKEVKGQLLSSNRNDDNFEVITKKSINFQFNPEIIIENEENYPDFIKLDNNKVDQALTELRYETIYEYNKLEYKKDENNQYINQRGENLVDVLNNSIDVYKSSNYIGNYEFKLISIDTSEEEINITNKDLVEGFRETSDSIKIYNAFNNFYDNIDNSIINKLMDTEQGAGFLVTHDNGSACWIGIAYFNQNYYKDIPTFYGHYSKEKSNGAGGLSNKNWFTLEFTHFDKENNVDTSPNYYTNLFNGGGDRVDREKNTGIINISNYIQTAYNVLNNKFPENNLNSDFLFLFDDIKTDNDSQFLMPDLPISHGSGTQFVFRYNPEPEITETRCWNSARVFWRTNEGEWVQLYNPLIILGYSPSNHRLGIRNQEDKVRNKIKEYFENIFPDFIYCYSNNVSLKDAKLWTYINNYCHNKYYNFPIKIYKKLNCNITDVLQLFTIKDPLNFICEQELNESSNYVQYNIKSDENFLDTINNINQHYFEHIYIKNGKNVDKDKNILDKLGLYMLNNNEELERYPSDSKLAKCIKISTGDDYTYNKVLYNVNSEYNEFCPKYRYDWRFNSQDKNFAIDYNNTLVTPKTFKEENE